MSWATDLHHVLASLPVPVNLDSPKLLTAEGIDGLIEIVGTACENALRQEIDTLVKTHFLKNRVEFENRGTSTPLRFRHYLRLVSAPHRIAYTRFLLSDHNLAVEGLRHGNRVWRFVEREFRLCRFCCRAVEDECHALLVCTGHPSLTGMRADFLRDVFAMRPEFLMHVQTVAPYDFLVGLLHCPDVTKRLAHFVYDILMVFEQKEMRIPPTHIRRENA
ncbi:hypothetical protein C8R43DRAFT_908025 [Mycena crocata]|nr:hypothetical protein C8R43DRAFT_908025 [Mycena crocata]